MKGCDSMFKFFPELRCARFDVPVFSRVDFSGELDCGTINELMCAGVDVGCYPRIEVWNNETNEMLIVSAYYCNHILAFKDAKRISKNYVNVMCVVYCDNYYRTYTHDEIITSDNAGYVQVDVNE